MKILSYFLLMSMLFTFSCSLNKNDEKRVRTAEIQFIKEFITGSKIVDESFNSDNVLKTFCATYLKQVKIGTGFIYIIDAGCSTCIRYFIDFVYLLYASKIESSIVVVISGVEQKKIEFYLQQYGVVNDNITFYCLPEVETPNLEQYNSCLFYIKDKKVINMCRFVDYMENCN